ncbi:creatininase family protein [Halorarum halobium]|uniref:creatininase family protein n=1 Tax=Halorarum halobium TaxID=3075121 RepID=UPI0028B08572|nr:creatininase family protein [Halobaculum sp. XH14]
MVQSLLTGGDAAWLTRTASEIREIAGREGSILVVPLGSVEQHGDHLPVGTDSLLAGEVSNRTADRLVDEVPLLVTPTVWSGLSSHHLPFGGTMTAEFETAHALLEELSTSALDNGFDAMVLINGHGGNTSLVSTVVNTVGRANESAEVLGVTYFELATEAITELRDSDPGGMAHGGEFETSLMLHLFPDLVREELADGTYLDEPYEGGRQDLLVGGPVSVYRGFDAYSDSGAIGDPALADREKGAEMFEAVRTELEELLRTVHERNR